jgi:hypothetical protein
MTALDQVKAYAKAERAEGRPLHFDVAFAISRPTLKQIQQWFPVPTHLKKAEALEWLARRALATIRDDEFLRQPESAQDAYVLGGGL